MIMTTRNEKRRRKMFVKRAYNQNPGTIRVLWPMIRPLQGKSNDFLYIVLKTLIANRSLSSQYRIKQLVRGFSLERKPDSWNNLSLTVNPETNWFATCRDSNLEIIGPILGYYLKTKAENFCENVASNRKNPINFDDIDDILSICDNAVKPFVIELTVAERTVKKMEKFVHLSKETLQAIKVDQPTNDTRSSKIVVQEIREKYHDWAWSCLNSGSVTSLTSLVPSNDTIDFPPMSETEIPATLPAKTRSGRFVKKKKFFE